MDISLKLNLIPEDHKAELRRQRLGTFLMHTAYFLIFFSFAIAFILLGLRYTLQRQFAQITADTSLATKHNITLEQKIIELNRLLSNANQIVSGVRPWTTFLRHFATVLPDGIRLNRLDINDADLSIIEGTADSRDALVTLRDRLVSTPYITNVDVPLSDFQARTNARFTVRFHIDFTKLPPL